MMKKINTNDLVEEGSVSPSGKFAFASKSVSEAIGRDPQFIDLNTRRLMRGKSLEQYEGEE